MSALAPWSEADLLRLAASFERGSEHPLAGAIVSGAEARVASRWKRSPISRRRLEKVCAGHTVGGERVAVGTVDLLREIRMDDESALASLEANAGSMRQLGHTVMFVAVDGRPMGLLGVADPIERSTPEALRLLRQEGARAGDQGDGDHAVTAQAVAKELGLDEVMAGVKPEDKSRIVQNLQAKGHVVAMAGDGVNDAPALAQADVGVAMGTGDDVAMENAGVTLVKEICEALPGRAG